MRKVMKFIGSRFAVFPVALAASMTIGASEAQAGASFSTIAENIIESIEALPGLLTGLSYLLGLMLGVLGVLKIKDHVENPSQTPLKDGAIRLASGGALFALPIVYESMLNTIGTTGISIAPAALNPVTFAVN